MFSTKIAIGITPEVETALESPIIVKKLNLGIAVIESRNYGNWFRLREIPNFVILFLLTYSTDDEYIVETF